MKYGVICFINGKIDNLNDIDLGVFEEKAGLEKYCEREYFSYFDKKMNMSRNSGPKNTNKEIKYRGCLAQDPLEALIQQAEFVFKVEEVISSLGENDLKAIDVIAFNERGLSSVVSYNSKHKNVAMEANIYPLTDEGAGLSRAEFIKVRNEFIKLFGDENSKASIALHYGIKTKQVKTGKKKALYVNNQYVNTAARFA